MKTSISFWNLPMIIEDSIFTGLYNYAFKILGQDDDVESDSSNNWASPVNVVKLLPLSSEIYPGIIS